MSLSSSLKTILAPYQASLEEDIQRYLTEKIPDNELRTACAYALNHGGKRFRPILVIVLAEALQSSCDVSSLALAVEFFHTASLIADDLPCMDNDDFRRNKPSLHRAFNEATALLASYALIAEGYACLAQGIRSLQQICPVDASQIGFLALENCAYNTGAHGATGGQFLDLFADDLQPTTLETIIEQKTGALFEIAFVLGWLFGSGDQNLLPTVKAAAYHFGRAFQIADDLNDYDQDIASYRSVNIAVHCGSTNASAMLQRELQAFEVCLQKLGLIHSTLTQFTALLRKKIN